MKNNWNIFLLLIPSVVFAMGLAVIFRSLINFTETSSTNDSIVLAVELKKVKINETDIPVEIADTTETRRMGLSKRDSLANNQGMLFVFDQENVSPPFWMKDMKFAIDIIWINDNKIIQIDNNVTPDSGSKLYLPSEPIDNVLEVNAGFSEANNFKVGDLFSE